MSALYRKYYASNGIVAYGHAAGVCDHLFLWAALSGPDGFDTLFDLVTEWKKAT